jgi:hypothetical protein
MSLREEAQKFDSLAYSLQWNQLYHIHLNLNKLIIVIYNKSLETHILLKNALDGEWLQHLAAVNRPKTSLKQQLDNLEKPTP